MLDVGAPQGLDGLSESSVKQIKNKIWYKPVCIKSKEVNYDFQGAFQ